MQRPIEETAPAPKSRLQPALISRARLWSEFLALFVVAPMGMTALIGFYPLFPVLIGFTAVSLVLLSMTPEVTVRSLFSGPVLSQWRLILGVSLAAALACAVLVYTLVPGRALGLARYQPDLWLRIMLLYPILSAIPQEIVYRTLFFRRYGVLFPDPRVALAANAAAFSLAHLFYQNPVAIGSTLVAGLIFGWAYQRTGSLILVIILHSLAGQIMFTSGLGIYFYHGAIGHTP